MFDAEPMPFVIGQRVVEDEVFQRNTDLPDIVQERGDGARRFRDTLSLELGSEEIADRMRAFELAFDDLIRADAVMEGLGVEQLEQGEHFPVCRGKGGNDIGEFFPDAGVGSETENLFLEERAIFRIPEIFKYGLMIAGLAKCPCAAFPIEDVLIGRVVLDMERLLFYEGFFWGHSFWFFKSQSSYFSLKSHRMNK